MGAESSAFDPIFAFGSFAQDFRLIFNCITSHRTAFNIYNLMLTHKTSSISSYKLPASCCCYDRFVIVDRAALVRTASSRFIVHSVSLEKESATCNEEVLCNNNIHLPCRLVDDYVPWKT